MIAHAKASDENLGERVCRNDFRGAVDVEGAAVAAERLGLEHQGTPFAVEVGPGAGGEVGCEGVTVVDVERRAPLGRDAVVEADIPVRLQGRYWFRLGIGCRRHRFGIEVVAVSGGAASVAGAGGAAPDPPDSPGVHPPVRTSICSGNDRDSGCEFARSALRARPRHRLNIGSLPTEPSPASVASDCHRGHERQHRQKSPSSTAPILYRTLGGSGQGFTNRWKV